MPLESPAMPRSHEQIIAEAIDSLHHFRTRLGMYIQRADIGRAEAFLTGFGLGLAAAGVRNAQDAWWNAQAQRGWHKSPTGPVPQMEARGMTVQEIISELVEIEAEVLRRHLTWVD
jgi:hypothetical protein